MSLLELVARHPESFSETDLPCCLRGLWSCLMREREALVDAIYQPPKVKVEPLPIFVKRAA